MYFALFILIVAYFTYNFIQVWKAHSFGASTKLMFKLLFFAAPIDFYRWLKRKL